MAWETTQESKPHEQFTDLDNARSGYKQKCCDFADATMPSLYSGYSNTLSFTPDSEIQNAYPASALPARGITQLAAKFSSALIPRTNQPFVGISVRPADMAEINDNPESKQLYLKSSKLIQDEVYYSLSNSNLRDMLFTAFQQLQVFSTCLIKQDKLRFSVHRFDHFVITRDSLGDPQLIIIREYVRKDDIPEDIREAATDQSSYSVKRQDGEFYPLYTHLKRSNDKKKWTEQQFIGNFPVPDSEETYKANAFPYYVPRWKSTLYDNYGVGLVEENYGDILAANATRQTLLESYSIAVSGFIGLKPGSLTPSMLAKTKNWGIVPITMDGQLTFIQPNNVSAVTAIESFDARITGDMRRIFMMDVAADLTHDRTTAFQVNAAKEELDLYSGGILSTFEASALRPIVMTTIRELVKSKILGDEINTLVDSNDVVIDVKSGLNALGRESQQRNVLGWITEVAQTIPNGLNVIDLDSYIRWSAAQRGIPEIILKTPEALAEQAQAEQQAQLNQALINQIPETGGRLLEQQAAQQQQ